MGEPLRFTTLRVGLVRLTVGGQSIESDVRVLLGSDGGYRLLAGELSDPVPTIEEAVARAVPESCPPDVTCEVQWREDSAPLDPGEHRCPICGAPVLGSPRYPRKVCLACVLEATDAEGRSIHFTNTDLSGGFEARRSDVGTSHPGGECFVRGIRCQAEESKFGGIVVQPITD
jgi:hypothetical protein